MKKIIDVVKHVAPALASALDGPFSGVATKYLTDKFLGEGADHQDKKEKLLELLENPENLHKLKNIDKEFELEMKKLDIDVYKLEIDDKNSARAMAKTDNKPQVMLSIMFLLAYFLMLAAIFTVEISDSLKCELRAKK